MDPVGITKLSITNPRKISAKMNAISSDWNSSMILIDP